MAIIKKDLFGRWTSFEIQMNVTKIYFVVLFQNGMISGCQSFSAFAFYEFS